MTNQFLERFRNIFQILKSIILMPRGMCIVWSDCFFGMITLSVNHSLFELQLSFFPIMQKFLAYFLDYDYLFYLCVLELRKNLEMFVIKLQPKIKILDPVLYTYRYQDDTLCRFCYLTPTTFELLHSPLCCFDES